MNVQWNEQGQPMGTGLVTYATPTAAYDNNQHQPSQVVAAPTQYQPSQGAAAPDLRLSNQLIEAANPNLGLGIASNPLCFHQPQPVEHQLHEFWTNQLKDVEEAEFRNHGLPLARIKKIMKADEDVRMISAEAPVIFAKACEMFISELTLRSWYVAEKNKRRTLQKNDIAAATARADIFDFLVDIVPREDAKEHLLGPTPQLTMPVMGPPCDAFPYHFLPKQPHQVDTSGTMCSYPQQVWAPQRSDKPESSRNAQE